MSVPGHHSWCTSTVPAPIASCCQEDAVKAEELLTEALDLMGGLDNAISMLRSVSESRKVRK